MTLKAHNVVPECCQLIEIHFVWLILTLVELGHTWHGKLRKPGTR